MVEGTAKMIRAHPCPNEPNTIRILISTFGVRSDVQPYLALEPLAEAIQVALIDAALHACPAALGEKIRAENQRLLRNDAGWSQHRQAWHAHEMAFIQSQQRQPMFEANSGNQHIFRSRYPRCCRSTQRGVVQHGWRLP